MDNTQEHIYTKTAHPMKPRRAFTEKNQEHMDKNPGAHPRTKPRTSDKTQKHIYTKTPHPMKPRSRSTDETQEHIHGENPGAHPDNLRTAVVRSI